MKGGDTHIHRDSRRARGRGGGIGEGERERHYSTLTISVCFSPALPWSSVAVKLC